MPPGRRDTLFLLRAQIYQQHNHQKDLNPCLSLYYYGKIIVDLENTNKELNYIQGVCCLTK